MANTTYSEKLQDPRWQKKRLLILSRDNFTCKCCGDTTKTLHVHHKEYFKNTEPWDYPDNFLETLCQDCHKEEHFEEVDPIMNQIYRLQNSLKLKLSDEQEERTLKNIISLINRRKELQNGKG